MEHKSSASSVHRGDLHQRSRIRRSHENKPYYGIMSILISYEKQIDNSLYWLNILIWPNRSCFNIITFKVEHWIFQHEFIKDAWIAFQENVNGDK